MYRLFSILRSYMSSRSSTLAFVKSFIASRPRVRLWSDSEVPSCDWFWGLGRRDFVSFASGEEVLSASMVWFCILPTRFSRQERETIRSARVDSMGVSGASSSSIRRRYRSNSAWLSEPITSFLVSRPWLTAF